MVAGIRIWRDGDLGLDALVGLFFKPANTEVAAVLVLLVLSASAGAALLANRSDDEPELSIGRQRGAAFGALIGLAGCVAPYLFLSNLAFPRIG